MASDVWPRAGLPFNAHLYRPTIGHIMSGLTPIVLFVILSISAIIVPAVGSAETYAEQCAKDDACDLSGEISIGVLAPTSGGAARYGHDIVEAARLAESDFNYVLASMGERWSLNLEVFDTRTDPAAALDGIQSLHNEGITIVSGPSIDIITNDLLLYANDHDMLLLSCCSALPSLAIPDDPLFRILPNHHHHASEIVDLISSHDIESVVLVGRGDSAWIAELLESAKVQLASKYGIHSTPAITYITTQKVDIDTTSEWASIAVQEQIDMYGRDSVAVLYAGFEESVDFLRSASGHDPLWDVRWFGVEPTNEPNVADDAEAGSFAESVQMLSVQPTTPDSALADRIARHVFDETGTSASPYAIYGYDTIWLLGLSILDAKSTDASDVRDALTYVEYEGVSGYSGLDGAGDSLYAPYAIWSVRDGIWVDVTEMYDH